MRIGKDVKKICELLEPFYTITKLFSGIHYPTSNLYFMNIWTIHCCILDNKFGSDLLLSDMATMMLEKFEKYWDDYSVVLSFGVVFDPRLKFEILEFCLKKINPDTIFIKVNRIKRKLTLLFDEYKSKAPQQTLSVPSSLSCVETSSRSQHIRRGKDLLDVSIFTYLVIFIKLLVLVAT